MVRLSKTSTDAIDSRNTTSRRGGPIRLRGARRRELVGIALAVIAGGCSSASKSPEAFHDVLSCKPGEAAAQPDPTSMSGEAPPPAGAPSDIAVRANDLFAK